MGTQSENCEAGTTDGNPAIRLTRKKLTWLFVLLGLFAGCTFLFVDARRYIIAERQVLWALGSTNHLGVVTAEGTNILLRLDTRAIPVLLRWSEGRKPIWHEWVNSVRKIFKKPSLQAQIWPRKEMARRAFSILRERASGAVPRLQQRLSHPDPDVRRISAQMLGAIGSSIGPEAFHQMTNCLNDSHQHVRNDVIWAIQFHRPDEYPVETLLSVYATGLQDSFHVARQNAMIGLTRMGKKAAPGRAILEKALNDGDSSVRYSAQRLLNVIDGKPDAVEGSALR